MKFIRPTGRNITITTMVVFIFLSLIQLSPGVRQYFLWAYSPVNDLIQQLGYALDFGSDKGNDSRETDYLKLQNKELKQQNEALRKSQGIDSIRDEVVAKADILAVSDAPTIKTITINAGQNDGIKTGYLVTSEHVLVGRVERVERDTSQVMLLSDPRFRLPVDIDGKPGLLTGGISAVEVNRISPQEQPQVGSLVSTSKLGGIAPAGILVGRVSSVTKDSNNFFYVAHITSSLDVAQMRFVEVVK